MGLIIGNGGVAPPSIQMQIVRGGYYYMELRWVSTRRSTSRRGSCDDEFGKSRIPVFLSTKASDIVLRAQELSQLYNICNHSCYRFPKLDHLGRIFEEPIDIHKLRIALSHSSVLVSVFCNPRHLKLIIGETDTDTDTDTHTCCLSEEKQNQKQIQVASYVGDLLEKLIPSVSVGPSNSHAQLVGFGRAVSDLGLTASIYDVMVIPSLRRMGIGQMIVKKILRLLTSRDIYDIAAVCSDNERLFFKACGFGDDILGSTTMMYTRTVSNYSQGNQIVKSVGRKLLLVPPLRERESDLQSLKNMES